MLTTATLTPRSRPTGACGRGRWDPVPFFWSKSLMSSAALLGAPAGPSARSTWNGVAPQRGRPWCTSSGESRLERQYRVGRHHGESRVRKGGSVSESPYAFYVGVDWASETHQFTVLTPERRLEAERRIEHTGRALSEMADWLTALADGEPARIAVAIEVPRGPVVETLLERGFHVFAINPKQLDRLRDRHSPAGAKDDRRDGFVLADSLRTDRPAFRQVHVDDPLLIQLRELSRAEEELQTELRRLSNRLWEQLQRFYPQVLRLSPAVDEPWIWALLQLAPTPVAARALRRATLARLLARHRIRRVTAETVLAELHSPALRVAPGTTEAAREHIAMLLPRLQLLHEQRGRCARRIEQLLDALEGSDAEHRDVTVLRSLPGVGRVIAATMLAEAARPLAERDYHAVRTQGGVAPITRQSGKSVLVSIRYACNHRLRNALYHWGRVSAQHDPSTRRHYRALRQRGHGHARAIRGVIDRLLVVLMAMLRTETTYDPARRRVPAAA